MEKVAGHKAVIIDYGMGNLFSVKLACEKVGLEAVISNKPEDILVAAALILPGVGAFGDAMANLKKLGLIEPIKKCIDSGKPFLGVCLGMQLLMTESEEFGKHKGLDIIKGKVKKFPAGIDKVPQVGWNQIVPSGEYMYFVHSFYCVPEDKSIVLSQTNYAGLDYCSSLQKKNVFACQFHHEKSGKTGLTIYKNFANLR